MKLSVFVLLLGFSLNISAGGRSGEGKINHIYQRSSDGLMAIVKEGGDWKNPDNCQRSNQIVLEKDNPSRAEFYSALLASKFADKKIDVWLVGCVDWNGISYPSVSGLYTY